MGEIAIEVKDVKVAYRSMKSFSIRKNPGKIRQRRDYYEALKGVSFQVARGKIVGIIGKNGSGKSTLLNMLGGLDTPTEGEVVIAGQKLSGMNDERLTVFRRRRIGFVFQNYNLVPMLNVYENIILPVSLDGERPDDEYIKQVIRLLGIREKLQEMPNNLSGGQQQRVAIARALAAKPAILLCDEPTGNLDSKTSQDVLGLIKRSSRQFNQTVIMITHNEEIAQMADYIIRIEDGKIAESRWGA